jgi:hypothetical protein
VGSLLKLSGHAKPLLRRGQLLSSTACVRMWVAQRLDFHQSKRSRLRAYQIEIRRAGPRPRRNERSGRTLTVRTITLQPIHVALLIAIYSRQARDLEVSRIEKRNVKV